jgi:hypothetical protein
MMAADMATMPPVATPSPIGAANKGGAHPGKFTRHATAPGHMKGHTSPVAGTGRRGRKGRVK